MRIVEIVFILFLILIFSGTVAATDSNPVYDNSSQPAENLLTYSYAAVSDPTAPPSSTVNLVFIHHSTGENWLNDDNGGLGLALLDNNYFVSDTNYGWGPDSIGDRTDIGNWWEWFREVKVQPIWMLFTMKKNSILPILDYQPVQLVKMG